MQKSLFSIISEVCGLFGAPLLGFPRSLRPNSHHIFMGCFNDVRYHVKSVTCITSLRPPKNLRARCYFILFYRWWNWGQNMVYAVTKHCLILMWLLQEICPHCPCSPIDTSSLWLLVDALSPPSTHPQYGLSHLLPLHGEVENVGKLFWPRPALLYLGCALITAFLWLISSATVLGVLGGGSRCFLDIQPLVPDVPPSLFADTSSFTLVKRWRQSS